MSDRATEMPGTSSAPPPGWYNHPGGLQVLRWWDGHDWASHTRPLDAPAAPAADIEEPEAEDVEAEDARAPGVRPGPWTWAVALMPVAALGVAAIGAMIIDPDSSVGGPVAAGIIAADVLAFIAAEVDSKKLKKAGDSRLSGWGPVCVILSAWAYLLVRAIRRRSGADWGVFAACAAVTILVIAIINPLASAVRTSNAAFDIPAMQSRMSAELTKDAGSPVKVWCPADPPDRAGTKFTCIATASDGSTADIDVAVQDDRGDITWQVQGG
jgi:hypothetical protein